MGNNPTFGIYCQPNLVENITYFYRNLRDNSPTFIQNAPKIEKIWKLKCEIWELKILF